MAAIRVMLAAVVITEQQPPSLHRSLQRSAAPTSHESEARSISVAVAQGWVTRRSIVEHSSVYSAQDSGTCHRGQTRPRVGNA